MEQILATKLFIPTIRPERVSRPRLIKQLNDGLYRKLTLISAPAGFGKTTLVSDWLSGGDRPVTFLTLDEGDNEITRFLTYIIAALQSMDPLLANGIFNSLRSPQPSPIEVTLTALVNEVASIPNNFILVLDDYHLVDSQSIHGAISFLIENLPPQLHLVISTREDPPLHLARLRVSDQLTELRGADLRFTNHEAAEFLNQVMGLNLSEEDISALENRTEGWIAGLQLAAISLIGTEDTANLIKAFSGSNRLVLDYLIEEVLERQNMDVQTFLLRTAILNRLTGSLCDELTGQRNGQATLEALEHANMFIVPLDTERGWYRYHHLFSDLLRQKLHQSHPEQVSRLHQLASEWYEQKGLWSDAVRHAFDSKDFERAASLIEMAWQPMNMSYQSVTWLGWAKKLPDELVRSRPALSAACGWALLDTGDLGSAELRLQDAERWLVTSVNNSEQIGTPTYKMATLDEDELRSLTTSISNARAYLSQALGNVSDTVKYTQQATDLLGEDDYFERGLSYILQGFAYWANGELEAAHKAVSDSVSNMEMAGKISFIISFTSYLADIMIAQGCLNETKKTYLQLLEFVTEQGEPEVRETAVLHLGLSELYLEQGDMAAALQHLQSSKKLGEQPAFPPWYRHWICAHVRIMKVQGDLDGVMEMLNGAERLYYRHPIPDVRPLKALIARAKLAQGNLAEALRWVREQNLSVEDDLCYLNEFEHITLARLLIAQYRSNPVDSYIHDALRLLERLLTAAEEGGRTGSIIEILVLQVVAYEALGTMSSALTPLKRALKLAEPEGYVQIFVGEGASMASLLYEVLSQGNSTVYIQQLLGSFLDIKPRETDTPKVQSSEFNLIEPLSDRELEILQLIAEGLTNQEIGSQLYLSLNTVKAHTRNIYGKLGVNSRTQAAARARLLGVLPTT